jgi:hypothetical protein
MKHADNPFSLDSGTMRRNDNPPEFVAFREAAANLLIHQDYAAVGATASIKLFRDRLTYHNPGHAFADAQRLLEPGDKDVRNPLLSRVFRMIGVVEQAGTGIPTFVKKWQQLGYLPPEISNDKERRSFQVTMLRELLLSDEQLFFQASLGVSLTNEEARVFAYAYRQQRVSEFEAKIVLSLPAEMTRKVWELYTWLHSPFLQKSCNGLRFVLDFIRVVSYYKTVSNTLALAVTSRKKALDGNRSNHWKHLPRKRSTEGAWRTLEPRSKSMDDFGGQGWPSQADSLRRTPDANQEQ